MNIYSNGEIKEKNLLGDIFEPGFLFGWGLFEALRAYQGKIPFLSQHLNRLNQGISLLSLEAVNVNWEEEIHKLLKLNNLSDAYIRITVYKKRKGTGVLIYTDKFGYYLEEDYQKGFSALISSVKRQGDDICSQVKSLSYLSNRISWLQAQKQKKDEALIFNNQGFLVGGSRSNLFLINENRVTTPKLSSGAFCGITRQEVINIIQGLNISVAEEDIKKDDLFSHSEAFLTSSLMEVMPLVEVEGKSIGNGYPGELTLKILSEYRKLLI